MNIYIYTHIFKSSALFHQRSWRALDSLRARPSAPKGVLVRPKVPKPLFLLVQMRIPKTVEPLQVSSNSAPSRLQVDSK